MDSIPENCAWTFLLWLTVAYTVGFTVRTVSDWVWWRHHPD